MIEFNHINNRNNNSDDRVVEKTWIMIEFNHINIQGNSDNNDWIK